MRAGRLKQGAAAAVVVGVAAVVLLAAGFLVVRSKRGDDQGSHGSDRSHSTHPSGSGPSNPSGRTDPRVEGTAPDLAGEAAAVRDAITGAGQPTTLRTKRCPTEAQFGGYVRPPAKVSVGVPAGAGPQLAAYASSNGALLPAPEGWECAASVGADGSQSIEAGPVGSVTVSKSVGLPEVRGHGPAVRALLVPACEGCIATAICSFFSHSTIVKTYESLQPCAPEPDGELRYRLSGSEFLFIDPPGVRGTSDGSGGSLPSLGVLGVTSATGVRQLSCTIARPELDRCAAAAVAFLDLGRGR